MLGLVQLKPGAARTQPASVLGAAPHKRVGVARTHVTPAVSQVHTNSQDADTPQTSKRPFMRLTILPRLAACVEMEEAVLRFENVAGRSAMMGFLAAVISELIADQGLFSNFTVAGLPGVATFITCGAAIGTALALGSREQLGKAMEEAVISSLTAVKRSAASVSQQQLDEYVDLFFDRMPVFDVALSSASYDDLDENQSSAWQPSK